MSATLMNPTPRHESVAAPAARLALKPDGAARGLLDGAWWPRSRDLLSELPTLTDVLDPLWGRITRIAVNPEHWPVVPRRVPVEGHVVKVGWFTPEIDPRKLHTARRVRQAWMLGKIFHHTHGPATTTSRPRA